MQATALEPRFDTSAQLVRMNDTLFLKIERLRRVYKTHLCTVRV